MDEGQTSFQDRIARIEATRAQQRADGTGPRYVSQADLEAHIEELKSRSPGPSRSARMPKFRIPRLRKLGPVFVVLGISYGAVTMSGGILGSGSGASPLAGIGFQSSNRPERSALPTIGGGGFTMPDLSGKGVTSLHTKALEKAGVTGTVEDALADFHKNAAKLKK